jgi:hypothetical protein
MSGYKSKMGYRDDSPYRNEPSIDIHTPNGIIDMSNTGIPLMANGRILPPYSGEHQFDSNVVHEVPMHQMPDGSWMPGAEHKEYQEGGVITQQQQPQKEQQPQQKNYKVSKNLKDGYLPLMQGHKGSELCRGEGCSSAVSIKLSNLLEGISDEDLWAEDAWFNKDKVLKGDGALIYETKERDLSKMPDLPRDVWSKLQVGDYVELNRKDTNSSREFAGKRKEGLKNEGI